MARDWDFLNCRVAWHWPPRQPCDSVEKPRIHPGAFIETLACPRLMDSRRIHDQDFVGAIGYPNVQTRMPSILQLGAALPSLEEEDFLSERRKVTFVRPTTATGECRLSVGA